jgi:hypothetical protein
MWIPPKDKAEMEGSNFYLGMCEGCNFPHIYRGYPYDSFPEARAEFDFPREVRQAGKDHSKPIIKALPKIIADLNAEGFNIFPQIKFGCQSMCYRGFMAVSIYKTGSIERLKRYLPGVPNFNLDQTVEKIAMREPAKDFIDRLTVELKRDLKEIISGNTE